MRLGAESLAPLARRLTRVGSVLVFLLALSAQASAPPSQYSPVVSSSQVVVDRKTGLTWERLPKTMGAVAYSTADTYCTGLHLGGFSKGWRLPTMKELVTLVDVRAANPAIDASFFPGSFAEAYWTRDSFKYVNDRGVSSCSNCNWTVDFKLGQGTPHPKTGFMARVRCVHN